MVYCYADYSKPHTSRSDIYAVLSKLENSADSLFIWFNENHTNPKVTSATLSQLKNQLVSTLTEAV